jgi:hypothetical protein
MPERPIAVLMRVNAGEHRDGWVLLPRRRGRRTKQQPVYAQPGRDFTWEGPVDAAPKTRIWTGDDFSFPVARVPNQIKLADEIRTTRPQEWTRIIATLQVRAAINRKDVFGAVKAAADAGQKVAAPEIFYTLAREQNEHLKGARLVLWEHFQLSKKRVFDLGATKLVRIWSAEMGVLCPDLTTALFVHAALGNLRLCPCCDKPFEPARPDQHYCSIRCRETFRKRRLRASAKRGGK